MLKGDGPEPPRAPLAVRDDRDRGRDTRSNTLRGPGASLRLQSAEPQGAGVGDSEVADLESGRRSAPSRPGNRRPSPEARNQSAFVKAADQAQLSIPPPVY